MTGRVTDAADTPVVGATIVVTAQNGAFNTTTDAAGQYTITGIAVGNVTVVATSPNGLRRTVAGSLVPNTPTLTLDVRIPDAPAVAILAPVSGTAVIEGAAVTVASPASSQISVVQVTLFRDGEAVAAATTPPYLFNLAVPFDVEHLVLGARAADGEGNMGVAMEVVLQVWPDDRTIVIGRVVNESGSPVPNAGVTTIGNSQPQRAQMGPLPSPACPPRRAMCK